MEISNDTAFSPLKKKEENGPSCAVSDLHLNCLI